VLSDSGIVSSGRELHARFKSLGDMSGKTLDDVVSVVGPPSSGSSVAFGHTLLQWQETGCHVALLFDRNNQFVSVRHAEYEPPPSRGSKVFLKVVIGLGAVLILILLAASIGSRR
jgi:hypothetical protein